jgi:hypothetical protein
VSSRALLDPDGLPVTTATLIAVNWSFAWKSNSAEDACWYLSRPAPASQLPLNDSSHASILFSTPPPGSEHGVSRHRKSSLPGLCQVGTDPPPVNWPTDARLGIILLSSAPGEMCASLSLAFCLIKFVQFLCAEMDVFPQVAQPILNILARSQNPAFQKQCRKLLRVSHPPHLWGRTDVRNSPCEGATTLSTAIHSMSSRMLSARSLWTTFRSVNIGTTNGFFLCLYSVCIELRFAPNVSRCCSPIPPLTNDL